VPERPRIGRIIGLNALPLWLGLEERLHGQVTFVDDVPGRLNRMLSFGELDVSMASAWHLATSSDLVALDDVAIAADGAVGSILIIADTPAYQRLHLTPHSATSAALCRLLVQGVSFTTLEEPVADVIARGEAALVIGDQALELARVGVGEYRTDVGALWRDRTGLPMVYGRVGARADANPALIAAVAEALAFGQYLWREDPERVMRAARRRYPFTDAMMRRYLQGLRWDLDPDLQAGLHEFLQRTRVEVAP